MSKRYITLPAINKKVPLGAYVEGIKKAKANLGVKFPHGLSAWWPCTGEEIMEQFLEGVNDRINAGIPYSQRGLR